MPDFYKDLGVEREATPEEIKAAHRRLVKVHHPDKTGDRKEFEKVSNAYDVLKDPNKRKYYDEHGKTEEKLGDIALDIIASVFDAMLGQDLPPTFDYIAGLKEAILGMVMEAETAKLKFEKEITKHEKLVKKFRRKKNKKQGGNFFEAALNVKIRNAKERIGKTSDVSRNAKAALQLLDEYEFEADKSDDSPRESFFKNANMTFKIYPTR